MEPGLKGRWSSTLLLVCLLSSRPCLHSFSSLQSSASITPLTLGTNGFYAVKQLKSLLLNFHEQSKHPLYPACVWTFSLIFCLPRLRWFLVPTTSHSFSNVFTVCLLNPHTTLPHTLRTVVHHPTTQACDPTPLRW